MTALSSYVVVVQNLTRGWTTSATSDALTGETPSADNLRRVLAGPFKARWAFRDGLIPNPMDPDRVTLNLWARTIADELPVDLGDVVTVNVYLSSIADPRPLFWTTGRVTESDTDLVPTDPWASRTKVELTGFAADLGAKFIPTNDRALTWKRWWMLAEMYSGSAIFLPTLAPVTEDAMDGSYANLSIRTLMDRLIASYSPLPLGLTYVASYNAASPNTPPAAEYARPVWEPSDPGPLANPSAVRYVVVPAGRTEALAFAKPLQFIVRSGYVTVTSIPGSISPKRHPALNARWCRIPTNVRRTRDHIVNNVRLKGSMKSNTSFDYKAGSVEVTNVPDAATRGQVTREVETMVIMRGYDPVSGVEDGANPAAVVVGTQYLSDASVLASTRAYESLDVYPHLMPADEAANVLPYLAPHPPGTVGGDGRLLRHVTVYGVDEAIASPNLTPGGFITAGELSIVRGVMSYRLTTTPGQPIHTAGEPAPITVGQFIAKTFATSPSYGNPQVDPTIRVVDLDQIGA